MLSWVPITSGWERKQDCGHQSPTSRDSLLPGGSHLLKASQSLGQCHYLRNKYPEQESVWDTGSNHSWGGQLGRIAGEGVSDWSWGGSHLRGNLKGEVDKGYLTLLCAHGEVTA